MIELAPLHANHAKRCAIDPFLENPHAFIITMKVIACSIWSNSTCSYSTYIVHALFASPWSKTNEKLILIQINHTLKVQHEMLVEMAQQAHHIALLATYQTDYYCNVRLLNHQKGNLQYKTNCYPYPLWLSKRNSLPRKARLVIKK